MKLDAVNIKRFRSIEDIQLKSCGEFNVLIGKNNSGKSNILSAIQAFFSCITEDGIIIPELPFQKTIDFYGRGITSQIAEITLIFLLSLPERDTLIQDIVSSAPQMRNAVEGIEPTLKMSITLSITCPPKSLGFISKIAITNINGMHERIILNTGNDSALELNEQFKRKRANQRLVEALNKISPLIDREEWRYLTSEARVGDVRVESSRSPRPSVRTLLRRYFPPTLADEIYHEIAPSDGSIPSYDDFMASTRNYAKKLQEEVIPLLDEPLRHKIDTFAGEESSVPTYVTNILKKISNMKVLYLRELRKQIGKDEAARLLSLKMRRRGPAVLQGIQETVSALLGVKIDAFESDTTSSEGKAVAELDVDDFLVEVNGSGIREALRLILDVEFEQPDILLVEEPEIHLHPALETSMMRYLKRISSERQIFITTHSTNFLDTADMKNVYLISKIKSTQVQLLDFEEAETQVPKELGIRLSSLFMFDRLVFVEGPSDAAIIREWATTLGVNLNQANVGFINMGGARNILHYAAEGTLSFLKKRQVDLWFLIDRDERNEPEIAKIEKELGHRAKINVLKRREIENYLLSPEALLKFIKLKKKMTSNSQHESKEPTESDIKLAINECAERLKQLTIDKRVARLLCKPIYPSFIWTFGESQDTPIVEKIATENQRIMNQLDQVSNNAQKVYEEQSRIVNDIWSTQKLNMVPGDHLLDMVCKRYNIRFKKEIDGSRLASLMSKNEIDEEIQAIIRQIGNSNLQ